VSRQLSQQDPMGIHRVRDELRAGSTGQQFTWRGLSIGIGDLPLLRPGNDGGLVQVLRVAIESPRSAGSIAATVAEDGTILDKVTTELSAGQNRLLLFVPERDRSRPVMVEMTDDSGEQFQVSVEVRPQRHWSIFLVHHSHLDIGYTDPQSAVLRHHLVYLDSVLDLVENSSSWPEPAQFRWNVEAAWPLRQWLATRPRPVVDEFIDRVRAGRIEVTALPFSMHTEAFSMDELARQLWFADELRDHYGIAIDTAMQTDVPGATIGLLHALAGADIRYLAVAHNYAGRSVPHLVGGQQLTRPFYWRNDAGDRLCVWYTDTPHGLAYMEGNLLGLAEDFDTTLDLLPEYLCALAERPYPYTSSIFGWRGVPDDVEVTKLPYPRDLLHLRVQGALADNASPSLIPAEIVRRWSSEWSYPQLRLATNREFFELVEERLGPALDEFRGDWTDWWADGIGSGARPLGINRRAQSGIRSAQTLHALADTLGATGSPSADPWVQVDAAYDEMALFDEHTWGAANPWEDRLDKMDSGILQWHSKSANAYAAAQRTERLTEAGLSRLAPLWSGPVSGLGSVVVVNTGTWERSDMVRVFLPESRTDPDVVLEVVDSSTGDVVPCVTEPQEHAQFRPRGRHLSFVARNVPPIGYSMYELRASSESPAKETSAGDDHAIENEHYRVELDGGRGCVAHIYDRDSGQDLVGQEAAFGFNQYVYDRYATAARFNHLSSRVRAVDLTLLGSRSVAEHGLVTDRSTTSVWDRLTMRLMGEGIHWLETTLTLVRGVKRLDIANRVDKIPAENKESVFFAFPFNMQDPTVSYEITGGTTVAEGPHVPGSAQHMRAIRHWIAFETPDTAIAWATLEAPLVQFGNLHLPYAPFPPTLEPETGPVATIYSWAMNNIWDTNFPPSQQGEMQFRYALSTGMAGAGADVARRTATALTMPLLGMLINSSAYPGLSARGSFCEVSRSDVEVIALTRSRRGQDLVALLHSHVHEVADVDVLFPLLRVERAWRGTHLERHLEEVPVDAGRIRLKMRPGELTTLGVSVRGAADV
jgi:Glycosyl hydrolases family 38 N-terminal domain/Glycosyl hydrolases family 38 C-terminal domain